MIGPLLVLALLGAGEEEELVPPPVVEAEAPLDAPVREASPEEVREVVSELRLHLGARRTRLLDEGRPKLTLPALMMVGSGVAGLAGGFGAIYQASYPGLISTMLPLIIFGAIAHLAMGIVGSAVLPGILRAREEYDRTATTGHDRDLARLDWLLSEGSAGQAPPSAVELEAMQRAAIGLQREDLVARKAELLEGLPGERASTGFILGGVVFHLLAGGAFAGIVALTGGFRYFSFSVATVLAIGLMVFTPVLVAAGIAFAIIGAVRLKVRGDRLDAVEKIDVRLQALERRRQLLSGSPSRTPFDVSAPGW